MKISDPVLGSNTIYWTLDVPPVPPCLFQGMPSKRKDIHGLGGAVLGLWFWTTSLALKRLEVWSLEIKV